jgi:hypothetical protein
MRFMVFNEIHGPLRHRSLSEAEVSKHENEFPSASLREHK